MRRVAPYEGSAFPARDLIKMAWRMHAGSIGRNW
jgi:hypothetical protein